MVLSPSPYMSWSSSSLLVRVRFRCLSPRSRPSPHWSSMLPCSSSQEDKKVPPPLPKKPVGGVTGSLRADSTTEAGGMLVISRGRSVPEREKSLDVGDRQKLETRRRLLQTKRSASFRQNSATESADSIEIYITEAQTRLWVALNNHYGSSLALCTDVHVIKPPESECDGELEMAY